MLPTVVLAARSTALIARLTRSAMLDTLTGSGVHPYRSRQGLVAECAFCFRHALKNAAPPILTAAGTTFGYLLSGSFVVETIFAIPGIGYQSIRSIRGARLPDHSGIGDPSCWL